MDTKLSTLMEQLLIEYDVVSSEDNIYGIQAIIESFYFDDVIIIPITIYPWTAEDGEKYIRVNVAGYMQPQKEYPDGFFQEILQINDRMPKAKFYIDEDNDLGIAIDVNSAEVNSQNLLKTIESIGRWADYWYPTISALFD